MFATEADSAGPPIASVSERPVAHTAFNTVFRRFDPYGTPFQPSVPARLLVYETNPWGLDEAQLGALLAAADDRDIERVFISVVDLRDNRHDENLYVLRPLSRDRYLHPSATEAWPIVPHAIYPPSGAWGVISSDESHVLVGGSERFVDDLAAKLGRSQDEMIAAWLEDWSVHQDGDPEGAVRIGDWIPAQLAHVVGPERAERALRASRLRRWDLPPQ